MNLFSTVVYAVAMKKLAMLAQLALFAALLSSPVFAEIIPERLVYEATWSGIKAGSAVLEVTEHGDRYRIVNTIDSSGAVSLFFLIDDELESVVSRSGRPVFFSKNIKEGRHRAHRELSFDFTTLSVEARDLEKNTVKRESISARTHDSLSSIFFLRYSDLEPGRTILFDIHDTKRLWNAEVQVLKRQKLTTPAGTFRTIMVISRLSDKGESSRAGSATFWFTDDSRRIPVKITTKLKVGEITLTLAGTGP